MSMGDVASLATALVTLLLAGVTAYLAKATRDLARTGEQQLKLMEQEWKDSVRPYIHVTRAGIGKLERLNWICVRFRNAGLGPALSVRAGIAQDPDKDTFRRVKDLRRIVHTSSAREGAYDLLAGVFQDSLTRQKVTVRLEYHDLNNDWWATTVPLHVYPTLEVNDQEEQVRRMEQHERRFPDAESDLALESLGLERHSGHLRDSETKTELLHE